MSTKTRLLLVEITSVLSSLAYTWLYIEMNPLCFLFAILGALGFLYLCWKKSLIAESGLQVFYVFMAVYGYLNLNTEWRVEHWPWANHLLVIALSTFTMFGLNAFLKLRTQAKLPLIDSFTTVFSLSATFIMVEFVHENWLYWIVIDLVSIALYFKRKMYFGAFLFFLYAVLAIKAYFFPELW